MTLRTNTSEPESIIYIQLQSYATHCLFLIIQRNNNQTIRQTGCQRWASVIRNMSVAVPQKLSRSVKLKFWCTSLFCKHRHSLIIVTLACILIRSAKMTSTLLKVPHFTPISNVWLQTFGDVDLDLLLRSSFFHLSSSQVFQAASYPSLIAASSQLISSNCLVREFMVLQHDKCEHLPATQPIDLRDSL